MSDDGEAGGDPVIDAAPPRVPRHEDFDISYQAGTPPWDIGRPESAFKDLLDAGGIRGPVLDVGCGNVNTH
jgi:hypothetical protein